jgi:hypothetical protein
MPTPNVDTETCYANRECFVFFLSPYMKMTKDRLKIDRFLVHLYSSSFTIFHSMQVWTVEEASLNKPRIYQFVLRLWKAAVDQSTSALKAE